MQFRAKPLSVACGAAMVAGAVAVTSGATSMAQPAEPSGPDTAPAAEVEGVAKALDLTKQQARTRLAQQDQAHETYKKLPKELAKRLAGHWFDAKTGKLAVAVTRSSDAAKARDAGAVAKLVDRSKGELDQLLEEVQSLAGSQVDGLNSYGVDPRRNDVVITVNPAAMNQAAKRFVRKARDLDGVRVTKASASPKQQAGDVNPGDAWWPGSEIPCSVGFPATDASGGKHFVTAGHCTNDRDQPAYGEQNQQNRMGTSNVGGTRSVNANEGDMGVVAVTEMGWNLSASVNTWGQPATTVAGSAEAMVGDAVCHSGKTAPNFECGEVQKVDQTVVYEGGPTIEGLTFSSACSQSGDSGGAWLRSDKAVGLHSGGYSNCPSQPQDGQSIFQPVNEALTKWGLTLYTGGGDDTQPPSAPSDLRSTGVTSTTVSLAWDASVDNVGVAGYDVLRGTTVAATTTSTSATVSGLSPDTEYAFTVQARDAAGNKSEPTRPVTVRTSTEGGGGDRTFGNETDYPIRDFRVTISAARSTATGVPANPVTVKATATHTCQQDLQIGVVSPGGRYYELQRYGADNWNCTPFPGTRTFTFAPVSERAAAGTWTLRIGDNGPGDTGVLSAWSITV